MKAVTVAIAEDGTRNVCFDPTFPTPEPAEGEVLLKIIKAGICGTDLEILQGYKHLDKTQVLGHEFVGQVVKFGLHVAPEHLERLRENMIVVAEINCVSPENTTSRTAFERAQDPRRTALGVFGRDGAFAEFLCVPAENVHVVPSNMPLDRAVFAEPVAAACQIAEQLHIPSSSTIAVLGAGRLGCVVAMVLRALGKDVVVLARRALRKGIDLPVQILSQINLEDLRDRFDVVVDCTGQPDGLYSAIDFVKPRGSIVLKSTSAATPKGGTGLNLTPVVIKEVSIVGSRCGPFPVALRLLSSGLLPVETLISHKYDIEDANKAFQRASERGVIKVILDIKI